MNEFLELQKKCKKLQSKKIIKYFIFIILLISLMIGLYIFISNSKTNIHKPKKEQNIKKEIKITKKQISIEKSEKIKPLPKKIEKTSPKINKIKEINKTVQKIKIIKPKQIKELNKTIIKKEVKPIEIPKWNVQFNLDEIDLNNKPKITTKVIKKVETKEINKAIKSQQVFKTETITFDKALKLAKFYYNNNEYESSMKWCKIASNMNNENEEIWKLYALNLEKLNQKQKAIKVLKTYLKYKDSPELKFILQRLEK